MTLHICSICGKHAEWGKSWEWYGSYQQLEDHPLKTIKVCSKKCKDKAIQKFGLSEGLE